MANKRLRHQANFLLREIAEASQMESIPARDEYPLSALWDGTFPASYAEALQYDEDGLLRWVAIEIADSTDGVKQSERRKKAIEVIERGMEDLAAIRDILESGIEE